MYRQDDVNLRKHGLTDTGLGSNDVKKRVVPDEVRGLLQWDAELTNRFVAFMQNALPAISKSETKFMEISGSGFVWLPVCGLLYFMYPYVPKQLPVNLTLALILDIIVIGVLKAYARRRRPPTKNPDFFKSIGPDQFSFPSGHASRTILLAYIFTLIYPLFDTGFMNLVISLILWIWAFSVCLSRLLNGRHYLFDVLVGISLGIVQGFIVSYLWMSSEKAENLLHIFSDEAPDI